MKAYYDEKPSVISEVGNGSVLYRYGITEVKAEQGQTQTDTDEEQTEAKKQFVCNEVVVWKPVTSNRITEAVITDRWDSNYEQKLINEFNAAQLGLLGGAKSSDEAKARIAAYTDYLTERAELKAQVDADCATLGIE